MREAVISFPMFGENFAIDPPYSIHIGSFEIYFYGIIIGIGSVISIVSIGDTMRGLFADLYKDAGSAFCSRCGTPRATAAASTLRWTRCMAM